ncbi:hypothetical protein FNH09_02725 [Streptomyces adustus]|uniref:Uncharacterized protein n=1 Tax=Streptomyces adustus TaxID=1609272 RepID=A0A5N8V4Z5_9ACTN|nr:hypothetical protein [Streptomyces adustus]
MHKQADDAATAQRVWWWLSAGVPLGLLAVAALLTALAIRFARRRVAGRSPAEDGSEGAPAPTD